MKVCIVNANPEIGDKKSNIKKIKEYIKKEKADLYIFGEMFLTGYICREEVFSLAENEKGNSIKEISKISKENNCNIIFGMPFEGRRGIVYNAGVLVKPNGINIYKKNFLANFGPFEEKFYFKQGMDLPVFETKHCKIGICICYDIFFPELIKGMVLKGADLIACISASPSITKIYFEKVLPARAIENTVYVAYSNLVGEENGLVFWGGSQLYSPKGDLLARTKEYKEDYITYDIDFSMLKEARIARPTLRDTKPDIFLDLYNASKEKKVFNRDVKIGIKMAEKAKNMHIKEIDVYGNEDVAFGIKLIIPCERINIFNSEKIKAVFKGEEKIEVKEEDI